MDLPRYCQDCRFRAEKTDPYGCAYALLTGRTRQAQLPGAECTYKVKGDRYTGETDPKELMPGQKKRNRAMTVKKKCNRAMKKTYNRIDDDRCMELYQARWSDGKIGAEFGVTVGAVAQWRKRRHLPATNFKKGMDDMPRGKQATQTAQGESMQEANLEVGSAKDLRDWVKTMKEDKTKLQDEKEKLQANLEKATARGDALEAENRQLRKDYQELQSVADSMACEPENGPTDNEPVMALSVLTGLLGKISDGWPAATLTGNTKGCKALALHVLYGGDGKERNVEVQLLN